MIIHCWTVNRIDVFTRLYWLYSSRWSALNALLSNLFCSTGLYLIVNILVFIFLDLCCCSFVFSFFLWCLFFSAGPFLTAQALLILLSSCLIPLCSCLTLPFYLVAAAIFSAFVSYRHFFESFSSSLSDFLIVYYCDNVIY